MDKQLTVPRQETERQPETGMERIKNYLLSPEVTASFSAMMGKNALYYLNQVLIVVANSDRLQKCDPRSILVSAMRAAALRLSVDPSQGQAWIIPYNSQNGLQASFQLGYKGIYELAMRTNLYRFINVIQIFEGEELSENRMTGIHTIGGKRISNKTIGWMLYFQLTYGFEKTFYMSLVDIAAHGEMYSKAYHDAKSKWNDPKERFKMEKKTVLANGLRQWGRFNAADAEILKAIEEETIDGEFSGIPEIGETTAPVKKNYTEAEAMKGLGFGEEPKPVRGLEGESDATPQIPDEVVHAGAFQTSRGKRLDEMTVDELSELKEKCAAFTGTDKVKFANFTKAVNVMHDWVTREVVTL